VASKSLTEWYNYHLAILKKEKKYKNASENAMKILAGDMAQKSFDEQQKAAKESIGTPTDTIASTVPGVTGGRVGRGGTVPTPVITKNPVTKPSTPPVVQGKVPANADDPNSYNNRMQSRIASLGIKGYTASNPAPAINATGLLATLTDEQYAELAKVLKGLGYNVREKGALKQTLLGYFEEIFSGTTTYDQLLTKLKGRSIAGTGTGAEGKENLALRQIPAIDRGELVNFARSVASKTLMMGQLTPELEKQVVDEWVAKAKKGIVTQPTRKVRNPKTGKMENVVETTRAFDQETEELALTERLKTLFPDQYALAQGINFANDIKDVFSGGL
jgi:hypothetical protein